MKRSASAPNGFAPIPLVDLPVAEGELMVLVETWDSGKTKAWQMVTGPKKISFGTLSMGSRIANELEPKGRNVVMVFQSHTLYPHMMVEENIGFSLKLRRVPDDRIRCKVGDTAGLPELTECPECKPAQLPGSQYRRVALGRAFLREPSVFSIDEPLFNLDAKMRG